MARAPGAQLAGRAPWGTSFVVSPRHLRRKLRALRDELQRGGVHAVAQSRGPWPVREHVTEMAVTAPAANLDALHPVAPIAPGAEVVGIEGLEEARPAGARLEFRA